MAASTTVGKETTEEGVSQAVLAWLRSVLRSRSTDSAVTDV
jgi:hypothetical protein